MEESDAVHMARQFIKKVGINTIPVEIDRYAQAANAIIKISDDLDDDESGHVVPISADQHIIVLNGKHTDERQRFTALHEIAHIVLDLPSQKHDGKLTNVNLMSYSRRPAEEIFCDTFAAECLLPYNFFMEDIEDVDVSMDNIKELSGQYKASLASTCSRFVTYHGALCAYVLVENGIIRYVKQSKALRELNCWINIGEPVVKNSVAYRLINSTSEMEGSDKIDTRIWFTNPITGYDLLIEEAIRIEEWKQCLSLISFDENLDEVGFINEDTDKERPLLEELDGILPWPSKSRKR